MSKLISFSKTKWKIFYQNAVSNGVTVFSTGNRTWIYQDSYSQSWNVYENFEIGIGNETNYIITSVAPSQNSAVQGLRLYLSNAISLTTADVGKYVIIDGPTYSTPECQGIQTIETVNTVGNYIEINFSSSLGYDFTNANNGVLAKPNIRVFESVRFSNLALFQASTLSWSDGDLVWIDHDISQANSWTVYEHISGSWNLARIQPPRVDGMQIADVSLFDTSTQIANSQMIVNDVILPDLTLIDPLGGLFPGIAKTEIDYMTENDPAKYTSSLIYGSVQDPWGSEHIGRVWWDISTVRYLEPYTDQIGINSTRDLAEINYRSTYWATIAPDTSVDVYEWTQSTLNPADYMSAASTDTTGTYGNVYLGNINTPSYTQTSEYSAAYGKDITYYYFWVSGLTSVPNVPFRKNSIFDVATILENPSSQDIPWFAPIMQDGMLVSGIAPYLNDTSTALKVMTNNMSNDKGHSEWILVRPNDESSLPPEWFWRKLGNSLAGFDEAVNPLPNPSLTASHSVGILDGQNLFAVDQNVIGDRLGLLAARESFVGIVNNIFAQTTIVPNRPEGVASLSRSTPINQFLTWTRPDISYVIEPPPSNEWDYEVYSIQERNLLVLRPAFIQAITNNQIIRVLINNTNASIPQWSIWWYNPSLLPTLFQLVRGLELIGQNTSAVSELAYINANNIFTLAPSYEHSVENYAARNQLTGLVSGDRVYVINDETADNFWVIYQYLPGTVGIDGFGFVVHRVQSYRTSDFYSIVDWYDPSFDNGLQTITFSADYPPQVTYATTTIRDSVEGSNPNNIFVNITNGGDWFWTYFANGYWTTVAQHDATIALSSNFYNSSLDVHAVNTIETTTIANRDGSWEIKVLENAMRYGGASAGPILEDIEINEILFSMIHFIHSQQNYVDWIFKTSFITIAGYQIPLLQTPSITDDVSDSLISYVNEVKPYHCKIRDYTSQYVNIDDANVHVTDFDKPVYFDNSTNSYRTLNPYVNADLSIIANTRPWIDWYQNYTLPTTQTNGYFSNPVRHITTTIAFDRVTDFYYEKAWDGANGWDNIFGWDLNESGVGTAIDRIENEYVPLSGMPTFDAANLINTLSRYPIIPIDGNYISNTIVDTVYQGIINNANGIAVFVNPILNSNSVPMYDPNRIYGRFDINRNASDLFIEDSKPEERVAIATDDGLVMTINSYGAPGAPEQINRAFNNASGTLSLASSFYQSTNGLFVYINGARASFGSQYIVDYFGKTITIANPAERVLTRSFGFGGNGGIIEQHFVSNTSNITLTNSTNEDHVQVLVDGIIQNSSGYTVTGNSVSIANAIGNDIAVIVWDSPIENTCIAQMQTIQFSSGTSVGGFYQFTLQHADTQTIPFHAGTIVEVNGLRLTPPLTHYITYTQNKRFFQIDFNISSNTPIDLVINGIYYSNVTVPRWNSVASYPNGYPFNLIPQFSNYPPNSVPGQFVIYENYLIPINPNFNGNVIAIFYEAGYFDYMVLGSHPNPTLSISNAVINNATSALVTTFSNASVMGIQTHTYFATVESVFPIATPFSIDYTMVSFAGQMLAPRIDYDFSSLVGDALTEVTGSVLTIPIAASQITNSQIPVVVTVFTGMPSHGLLNWRASTSTPANARMKQVLDMSGWDEDRYDLNYTNRYDTTGSWLFDYPRYPGVNPNPVQVYEMNNRWEFTNQSVLKTGTLAHDLGPTDTQMTINLGLANTSTKLWPIQLQQVTIANVTNYQWTGHVFEIPDPQSGTPGVVWVGNERIEYMSLDYSPASYSTIPSNPTPPTIILGNIRRGTKGTCPQFENRVSEVFLCNGNQTTFTINAIGSTDVQITKGNSTNWNGYVSLFGNNSTEPSRYWPILTNDYTLANSSNSTVVTMNRAPPSNSYISIGVTVNYSHPAGTLVNDGSSLFAPLQFASHNPDRLKYPNQPIVF